MNKEREKKGEAGERRVGIRIGVGDLETKIRLSSECKGRSLACVKSRMEDGSPKVR